MLWFRGKNFVVTCTHALMGVARCIYGNCFVGKYFVVCFSTTKTKKILSPPPKNTRYTVYSAKNIGNVFTDFFGASVPL